MILQDEIAYTHYHTECGGTRVAIGDTGWQKFQRAPFVGPDGKGETVVTPRWGLIDPKGVLRWASYYTGGCRVDDFDAALERFVRSMPDGWEIEEYRMFSVSALNA